MKARSRTKNGSTPDDRPPENRNVPWSEARGLPLLCLTDKLFWEEAYGSRRRIAQLLRYLAGNWTISVFYAGTLDRARGLQATRKFPGFTIYTPSALFVSEEVSEGEFSLEEAISRERPKVLLAEFIRMTPHLKSCDPAKLQDVFLVVDTHDIMHQRTREFARFGFRSEQPYTRAEERYWLDHFDCVLAIQPTEAATLRRLTSKAVWTVMHGQEVTPQRQRPRDGSVRFGFFGSSGESQIYGLHWFLERVWEPLRAMRPDIEFRIFGGICERLAGRCLPPGVALAGFVEDLAGAYASIDIAVNPAQFGSGLSIKVVEALCFSKPLVCSPVAARGLPAEHGKACCLCQGEDDWIRTLTELAESEEIRRDREEASFRFAQRHFAVETVYRQFERRLYRAVTGRNRLVRSIDPGVRGAVLRRMPASPFQELATDRPGVYVLGTGIEAMLLAALLPADQAVAAFVSRQSVPAGRWLLGRPVVPVALLHPAFTGPLLTGAAAGGEDLAGFATIPLPPEAGRVIVFGTGSAAERLLAGRQGTEWILAFADNNPVRQGTQWQGRPVLAPVDLSRHPSTPIIVASLHHAAITRQLKELGVAPERIFAFDPTGPEDADQGVDPIPGLRQAAGCYFDFPSTTVGEILCAALSAPRVAIFSGHPACLAAGAIADGVGCSVQVFDPRRQLSRKAVPGWELVHSEATEAGRPSLGFDFEGGNPPSVCPTGVLDACGRVRWIGSRPCPPGSHFSFEATASLPYNRRRLNHQETSPDGFR